MTVVNLADHRAAKAMQSNERPVKRSEIQEILGCGRTTIFEYLALGMPHIKTRSQNLFYPSQCRAWLIGQGIWQYADGGLSDPAKGESA